MRRDGTLDLVLSDKLLALLIKCVRNPVMKEMGEGGYNEEEPLCFTKALDDANEDDLKELERLGLIYVVVKPEGVTSAHPKYLIWILDTDYIGQIEWEHAPHIEFDYDTWEWKLTYPKRK